jgi:hypothetical protein
VHRYASGRAKKQNLISYQLSSAMCDQPQYNRVLQFFSTHPLIGLIGTLGALASICAFPFTVWPWLAGSKPELTYCVNPVQTVIVQTKRTSDVAVTYKGTPVEGNVTAVQIAVWNGGREPIRSEDVLSYIQLRTKGTCKLLDVSIAKTNRSVTGFFLNMTNAAPGIIGMGWRILEKGDGAVIQVVYTSTNEVSFTLDGVVVGQKSPTEQRKSAEGIVIRRLTPKEIRVGMKVWLCSRICG